MIEMMEQNLTALPELLRMSKSLVFVPDHPTAKIVRKVCHSLGLPYWVNADEKFDHRYFERDLENFATIFVVSFVCTHGWKSSADQVIWVGPVPTPSDAAFVDYIDALTNGSVDKHFHLENHGVSV